MTRRVFDVLQEQRRKGVIPYVLTGREAKPFVTLRKCLDTAGKAAGAGHVHLHMFRHTFATGHKTMVMALRYAKATPTQLESAIAALDRVQADQELGVAT
jgi:integrase